MSGIILPSVHPIYSGLLAIRIEQLNGVFDMLHLDLADGSMTDHRTCETLGELETIFTLGFEVELHLMTTDVIGFLKRLPKLPWKRVNFHIEASVDTISVIDYLKSKGYGIGIAVNPDTEVSSVYDYVPLIDLVQLMGKAPGDNKKSLDPYLLERLETVSNWQTHCLLEVDGGATPRNSQSLRNAGANILVSGRGFLFAETNHMEPTQETIIARRDNLAFNFCD